jgi:hypothetical protein
MDDAKKFLEDFHDYLAPRLDTYESAIYLYVIRHTRLIGRADAVFGFMTVRNRMTRGAGENGTPMSYNVIREKLNTLQAKGCIEIMDSTHAGRKIRAFLPIEIPGVVVTPPDVAELRMEELDFFESPELRKRILERESHNCFYCLRKLDGDNYVIEHIVSRPLGNNSYRNLVAACRQCNNIKKDREATDYLRSLVRSGRLSDGEFVERLEMLQKVIAGEVLPP